MGRAASEYKDDPVSSLDSIGISWGFPVLLCRTYWKAVIF